MVSKMPFCFIWGSRNCHLCIWGLENTILLYMGASQIPFFVYEVSKIGKISSPSPFLNGIALNENWWQFFSQMTENGGKKVKIHPEFHQNYPKMCKLIPIIKRIYKNISFKKYWNMYKFSRKCLTNIVSSEMTKNEGKS